MVKKQRKGGAPGGQICHKSKRTCEKDKPKGQRCVTIKGPPRCVIRKRTK